MSSALFLDYAELEQGLLGDTAVAADVKSADQVSDAGGVRDMPAVIDALLSASSLDRLAAAWNENTPQPDLDAGDALPPSVARQLQWPQAHRHLVSELHSGSFIDLLEAVSGEYNLLPDPFLTGAGYELVSKARMFASPGMLPENSMEASLRLTLVLTPGRVAAEISPADDTAFNLSQGQGLLTPAANRLLLRADAEHGATPLVLTLYFYKLLRGKHR